MPEPKSGNLTWHTGTVSREEREQKRGHRGVTLWLTGLSGSGKSTLAAQLEHALLDRGCVAYVLDGDNVRHGLSRDLGFSPAERRENVRRTGEVAKLFTDAGVIVLCAFISPYREDRAALRRNMAPRDFVEIYVKASLDVCEARDPKGLYKKARAGNLDDMTGIGAPYEAPEQPELTVDTEHGDLPQSTARVLGFLEENGYIGRVF